MRTDFSIFCSKCLLESYFDKLIHYIFCTAIESSFASIQIHIVRIIFLLEKISKINDIVLIISYKKIKSQDKILAVVRQSCYRTCIVIEGFLVISLNPVSSHPLFVSTKNLMCIAYNC